MLNESVEALRHIATTSLFMQNEQKSSMSLSNRIVPIIKEPDIPTNAGNATYSVLCHIQFTYSSQYISRPIVSA